MTPLPPVPESPTVSVVIPARDAADHLEQTVAAVLAQDHPLDVVIAVGPSQDETWHVAQRLATAHTRVRVIDNPVGTAPSGLNAAIAASRGDIVVRVDAHARIPEGYVARAVQTLRETGAANVGGMQVPTADSGFARAVAAAMRSPVGAGGATYRVGGEPGPVETVYLGVFRRKALADVGGYDETLVRNQDFELNHRLRQAGGTVWFDPELAVAYRPRGSVRGLWSQYLQYGAWKRLVLRRHPGSLELRQLVPPVFVVALVVAIALLFFSPWPLVGLGAAYLAVIAVAAVSAADGLLHAPAVALALATMHLAWGTGFLLGGVVRGRTLARA